MSLRPPLISRTKNVVWFFNICKFPSIVLNVPGITCPIFRLLAWHVLFESIWYGLLLYREGCVHVCGYVHARLHVCVCVSIWQKGMYLNSVIYTNSSIPHSFVMTGHFWPGKPRVCKCWINHRKLLHRISIIRLKSHRKVCIVNYYKKFLSK